MPQISAVISSWYVQSARETDVIEAKVQSTTYYVQTDDAVPISEIAELALIEWGESEKADT